MRMYNNHLDGCFREARIAHFKAELAERELARFKNEVEEQNKRQAALHATELKRAERSGRRRIAEEMASRSAAFDSEFRSYKNAQDFFCDFRECRGSVAILQKSKLEGFSHDAEFAEMSGYMNGCAHAESLIPPNEGNIQRLWTPIEVLADTGDAGVNAAADDSARADEGEVDQPIPSFGCSMSGYFDYGL